MLCLYEMIGKGLTEEMTFEVKFTEVITDKGDIMDKSIKM